MTPDIKSIVSLEVPLVVVLGERPLKIQDIRNWVPGSIVELGKEADDDLEVRVNNKSIGNGTAVKIGENFGVKISYIGDPKDRINAMGPDSGGGGANEEVDAEALAAALLDGQI